MPLYRALLQTLGATLLLALALACNGSSSNSAANATTVTVNGTVTYTRIPLVKNALGVPTGLADASVAGNLQSLPARSVSIRIYQQVQQTQPNGSMTPVWILAGVSATDSTGAYSLTVTKDRPTMVEVLSSFNGGSSPINLIAEPAGINSPTLSENRLRFALRKATDGTAPSNVNVPNSVISTNATVNFTVGLNDAWWLVDPSYSFSTTVASTITLAQLETSIPGHTTGTGSRVLAIGDTIASFLTVYGTATPGTTLDLHYWPGRSESRGSYIEYGPYNSGHFPQAFDSNLGGYLFFGSLRGDPANDDAWDEGVIMSLLARGVLYSQNTNRTYTTPLNPLTPVDNALTDLSPDMARIEGLADAMAANVLKSPYLADTQGTALAGPVKDIRDISSLALSQKTPYSAPVLRAFAWELILKANSITTPGVAANWATIDPLALARFFLYPTTLINGASGATRDAEPLSIYSQMVRLSEAKSTAEPVDLNAIFTVPVLGALGSPFGIDWPRPATGAYASFVADWGTDPPSPFPSVVLSMAKAAQVNGTYPNLSQGEVFYAGFSLNADKRCTVSATIAPALAAGVQLEVDLPRMARTFSFSGTGGSTQAIIIPVNSTAPYYHPVRLRLKSPTAVQPDVTVTLAFTPLP